MRRRGDMRRRLFHVEAARDTGPLVHRVYRSTGAQGLGDPSDAARLRLSSSPLPTSGWGSSRRWIG